ncbi:MAG: hypothetical protein WC789_11705 [Lentisphaeria bacterium]|jgi:hypothetical protein
MARQWLKAGVTVTVTALVAWLAAAGFAALAADLPAKGTAEKPVLLLELGKSPAAVAADAGVLAVSRGEAVAQAGVGYVAETAAGVTLGHKGLGEFGAAFRFTLAAAPAAGPYTFWARWQQGGDPGFCPQEFRLLAGPAAGALEERGVFRLTNDDPWKFNWVNAPVAVELKAGDQVVEVRNAGKAQDAKMFDAFLLVSGNPPPPAGTEKKIGEITVKGAGQARGPLPELPARGTAEKPQLLLQLGAAPAAAATAELAVVAGGEVVGHEGDRGIEVSAEEVQSLRAGQGKWAVNFRFRLPAGHPAGDFTFWARWKQGGDPNTSAQAFELWAGPDEASLEKRGASKLKPGGWSHVWRDGARVTLKPEDRLFEVRNSGNGMTGKVFSAFLLGGPKPPPPPVELPLTGSAEQPVIALGFGKVPFNQPAPGPAVRLFPGTIAAKDGAIVKYASIGGAAATVAQKGFGETGTTFQFELDRPVPPGFYSFHARYMSGGEPSQVRQSFTVKAGPDAQSLGERGSFQTLNKTPFKQQWLAGNGTFAILPGDQVIQIVNRGKAHDAKVFEGFALGFEAALPAWLTAEKAARRAHFLAQGGRPAATPETTLYLVDGPGAGDAALFAGLAQDAAKPWLETAQVHYLIGAEAEKMAQWLNLPATPAAVVVDADRKVRGVLAEPKDAAQVAQFLASPGTAGLIPPHPELATPAPTSLRRDGAPAQWLVGVNWPGQNGVGRWGLDAEAMQRPNPGDLIAYGYYTAGNRRGEWSARGVDGNGACVLTEKLEDSYAWGKATNYAVVYLQADQPVKAVLRFQHTGIKSALYLDGVEQPLADDQAPPFTLGRPAAAAGKEVVAERAGQEIHDDVAAVQAAEPPRAATLELAKGWHCLVVKLVHAQDKGARVLFAGKFTGEDGQGLAGIRTQASDPTVPLGVARAAAGLWPSLTLKGIPGNLPRPGEPLTLVADLRVTPSFLAKWCPAAFLPINATLRVRLADYDGKEIKTVEAKGSFPAILELDLGPAPGAGYYSLTPELVTADGRLVHRFHPDGFSVVLGNAAQKERVEKKELMNSWYYAFNDWETFAPWLERIGMLKNVGSTPGLSGTDIPAKWEDAKKRGIVLFADFAGDSNWMNNDPKNAEGVVALTPKYTRYFKGINEVDGRFGGDEGVAWHISRQPQKYVERTKWQHAAVHQARPDAIFFGGSVYTSGNSRRRADHPEIPGPREWLRECLKLGLDQYLDAWDVHAYPQFPPRLEAPSVSNSPRETDLGVRDVYRELGIPCTKPFLLGETSAMVFHGFTALRWQADTLAKMAAWTNSREDWLGIALCAAHHDRRKTAEEYAMARNPGEAAAYTAGALIDGLPYRRVAVADQEVQAGWFGNTFMVWRTDDRSGDWTLPLDGAQEWLLVDVVGRAKPLAVQDGRAIFPIGPSPVYVLAKAEYERLTRLE